MLTETLLIAGLVLLTMCLAEKHVNRLPLSPATVYLLVGWITGELMRPGVEGSPIGPAHASLLVILTESALLISLFSVGLKLRAPPGLRGWRVAGVLATVGMVVTAAGAAVAAALLLPGLGWPAA